MSDIPWDGPIAGIRVGRVDGEWVINPTFEARAKSDFSLFRPALEKMFGFLKGYRYRLVLFGAKSETFVDDVSRYRNDGQWTDFYHAFARARELAQGYPKGTELKLVLVTDAIVDPDPKDWSDVPPGWDVRSHSMRKTVDLVREMQIPLYVMLIGDPAGEVAGRDREQSPGFVLDLVQAANGAAAAPLAQTVAAFFQDDGVGVKVPSPRREELLADARTKFTSFSPIR